MIRTSYLLIIFFIIIFLTLYIVIGNDFSYDKISSKLNDIKTTKNALSYDMKLLLNETKKAEILSTTSRNMARFKKYPEVIIIGVSKCGR